MLISFLNWSLWGKLRSNIKFANFTVLFYCSSVLKGDLSNKITFTMFPPTIPSLDSGVLNVYNLQLKSGQCRQQRKAQSLSYEHAPIILFTTAVVEPWA